MNTSLQRDPGMGPQHVGGGVGLSMEARRAATLTQVKTLVQHGCTIRTPLVQTPFFPPYPPGDPMKPLIALALALLTTAPAFGWSEPPRGSADRRALMDAVRPHVEAMLGAPIEFMVDRLRQEGDVAFAMLSPQRPGGGKIDLLRAPVLLRDGYVPDNTGVQALYRRSGTTWVAVHWAVGATDVWFSAPEFCRDWRAVLPEYCR
jgi:hypothetical protein